MIEACCIDGLVSTMRQAKSSALDEVRRLQSLEDSPDKEPALRTLFDCLDPREIPANLRVNYYSHDGGISLAYSIIHAAHFGRALSRNGVNYILGGITKDKDQRFGMSLDVPIPKRFGDHFQIEEIPVLPESIVKPFGGSDSTGVFLIDGDLKISSVRSGNNYRSIADGVVHEIVNKNRKVTLNRWVVEEAIFGPGQELARNLKVFIFYGEIGLFLETLFSLDRGSVKLMKSAYDPEGRSVQLGFKGKELFGIGIPEQDWDYSRRISLASPVPMLRVDFLRGRDDLYLGEITRFPGPMYRGGDLTPELDIALGKMFIEAEARLFKDLLQGKSFDHYREIYEATW